MKYVPAVFATCCVAGIVAIVVSVRPVAGQKPETEIGAARQQLDERASMLGTRSYAVPTSSAVGQMWNPGGAVALWRSWGDGPLGGGREVQLVSGRKERSKTRTAIGGVLVAAGALAAYLGYFACGIGGDDAGLYTAKYDHDDNGCVLDPYPDSRHDVFTEHAPNYRFVGGGAGAMGLGFLLLSVWADVEIKRSQSRVEVAMPLWSR